MTGTQINVVGISHKTAPLARRERFALSVSARTRLLSDLGTEAVVLVTCNRTELYGVAAPSALTAALYEAAGGEHEALYVKGGFDAVRHLYQVAAGLDSMVVGEPQILGQVKRAMSRSLEADTLGPTLGEMFRRSLHVGRRVRAETEVGRGLPSVPKVATGAAERVIGRLDDSSMVVVGAGKLGELTARALRESGASDVVVTNRNRDAADTLAREIGGRSEAFDLLDRLLKSASIVLTCTGSPQPIFSRSRLEAIAAERKGRPLLLIDIAVPRDVEASAREIDGVRVVDLDDLRGWSSEAVDPSSLEAAHAIVDAEVEEFRTWIAVRAVVPTIRAIRERAEEILTLEIERVGPEDHEALLRFGRRVVNKLLHHPLDRLKQRAATEGEEYADWVHDLFALDVEYPDPVGNGSDKPVKNGRRRTGE